MRAAAFAPESFQKQVGNLGRNAVLEALGFFVRARPFEADHVGEQLFGEAVAQDQMLRDAFALGRKLDLAAAANAQVAAAGHALERSGDGRRSHAKIFGQARADRHLLFLDDFPDGLQIVFLRDAGFFTAHDEFLSWMWRNLMPR